MCGDKKQQEGESPSLPPLVAVPSRTPCDPPAALTEGNALSEPWPCIREPSCGIQDAQPSPVMCPLCPVSPGFMQAVRKPLYGRGRWAQGSLRAQTVLPFLALPGSRPPLPPSPLLEASGSGWSQAGDSRWGSSARAAEDTCLPPPPRAPGPLLHGHRCRRRKQPHAPPVTHHQLPPPLQHELQPRRNDSEESGRSKSLPLEKFELYMI